MICCGLREFRWFAIGPGTGRVRPMSTPLCAAAREYLAGPPKRLLIGGEWVEARSGETFEAVNPATEEVIGRFASGAAADVDAAVAAARRAFEHPSWSAIRPHERTSHLLAIARIVDAHREELAQLETLNNGTPIAFTRAMVDSVREVFEYYAGWATKIFGETNPSDPSIFNYTLREPVGVCGQIIPWNGPLSSASWKLAPALACGNTCILKPAEQTPLTAIRLGELILEAGLPPGVVNIVTGFGETAGAAIAAHPDIDKVGFTGSTEIGKLILKASAGNLKKVTLELGGKSPNIIFPDADLAQAVPSTVGGFCFLAGQICVASSRVFIQERIYDEVVDAIGKATAGFKTGDPFDETTTMGPLVSKQQFDRVSAYIDIGQKEGARVQVGGAPPRERGYFVKPTVFAGVTNEMRIAREEIFGPVAAAIPFKDEHDAVFQGNRTEYGLAAAVWTRDIEIGRAHV